MSALETVFIVPGLLAGFVGIREWRSDIERRKKVQNLVPVILVLVLVAALFLLGEMDILFVWVYAPQLVYGMASLSVVIGLSGVVIKYSRKSNSILMGFAGFLLAYYWLLILPRA